MKPSITPEIIEALATLRYDRKISAAIEEAVNILDNAGIFAAIDEATGYDVDPEPERVSKCTCEGNYRYETYGHHQGTCPGDPAEWGDMAYTTAPKRRQCPNCTGQYTVNKNGSLRAHMNDMCQPCK